MKKLTERVLLFVIGFPLVIGLVVFLPYKHHLAVNLVVIMLSALGAAEFAALLRKKFCSLGSLEAAFLGAVSPVATTLAVSFDYNQDFISGTFMVGASWLLVSRIFTGEDKLKDAVGRVAAGCAVLVYPGLFMSWIIRINWLAHAEMVLLMFLFIVIANDSLAWAAGMLWGKGNQGIIQVSPHKSVAGFIGGLAASITIGLGAVFFIPQAFSSGRVPSIIAGILLGLISGVAACLGDLGESALKRSANIKDSGTLMPGRGGVLDSIDSMSLAAPVYYLSYWFLFT
ncbi:MAG: phosphatidate cytidylyltransferase [Treponema sp.]|jgi:phosphatidate cytidylyltransferase|nr:phosphatidate cytidylyltransferase [Treponema sp.]